MNPSRHALAFALTVGCGARSGLVDDAPGGRCVAAEYVLARPAAQAMLLLDESDSMGWDLSGQPFAPPSRWSIVQGVLRERLPRYNPSVSLGLWTFPSSASQLCASDDAPRLAPSAANADALVRVIDGDAPHGLTPTRASLTSLARYWVAPSSALRSVVLLTDGGPNCNTALDPRRCVCAVTTQPTCASAEQCLDDVSTLAQITALARASIPTFVLGIDNGNDPALTDVLNRMALAGGRPRPSDEGTRYYRIARGADLSAALDAILPEVAGCAREAPTRDDVTQLDLDGAALTRDPTHRDGWDWASDRGTTLRLYGPSCRRSVTGAGVVRVRVACD